MIGSRLLTTIQSGKTEELYQSVTKAALYLATGGFLEEANTLLSALWKHHLPHDPNTWLPDRAFQMLWYVSGIRPEEVPFSLIALDQLEVDHRNYLGGEHYVYPMPKVDWRELAGKNAFRQAQIWFPNIVRDVDTLFLLEKALQQAEELAPHEFCSATAMAAELAASLGNTKLAISMAQWWAKKYQEFSVNYNFPMMAQNRHVAPLLLNGILADALGLSKEKCQRIVEEVTGAIEQRMQMGRSLVYGDWNWEKLLRKLSEVAIAFDGDEFTEEEKQAQWIGRAPASEKAIAATESRLGLKLPDDYKSFLSASNGLSAFPFFNPTLMAVEEIDWYKKLEEQELYDITKTYIDVENEDGILEPYTERALLISRTPDEQMIWLIPPLDETETWQAWFFASWVPGERRYPSFRHFMEEGLLALEEQGSIIL